MKVNKEYIERLFSDIIDENIFIKGVISSPVNKEYPYSKINIKPLKIKDEIFIQFEQFKDNKAFHENICIDSSKMKFSEILDNFKQILISVNGSDYQILKGKNDFNLKKSENTKTLKTL